MDGDFVVDTSIIAKFYFDEDGSDQTRRWVKAGHGLVAPRHLLVEIASVALKKARDGLASTAVARSAIERTPVLLSELIDVQSLLVDAFDLGLSYRTSVYDALFAVLATRRGLPLVTADLRLKERLLGGGHLGTVLTPIDLG